MKRTIASANIRPALAALAALAIINASLPGHRESAWGDSDHVSESIRVVDATQVAGGQLADEVYLCIGLAGISLLAPLVILLAIPVCASAFTGTLG